MNRNGYSITCLSYEFIPFCNINVGPTTNKVFALTIDKCERTVLTFFKLRLGNENNICRVYKYITFYDGRIKAPVLHTNPTSLDIEKETIHTWHEAFCKEKHIRGIIDFNPDF